MAGTTEQRDRPPHRDRSGHFDLRDPPPKGDTEETDDFDSTSPLASDADLDSDGLGSRGGELEGWHFDLSQTGFF
jgi:hypothetical protein